MRRYTDPRLPYLTISIAEWDDNRVDTWAIASRSPLFSSWIGSCWSGAVSILFCKSVDRLFIEKLYPQCNAQCG